eukprot:833181-Amorphochlora_amoeboformis.AAC.1
MHTYTYVHIRTYRHANETLRSDPCYNLFDFGLLEIWKAKEKPICKPPPSNPSSESKPNAQHPQQISLSISMLFMGEGEEFRARGIECIRAGGERARARGKEHD